MKTRTTTIVPIFVAVLATAGFGFYVKQSNKAAEQPNMKRYRIPKDLRVEILEMSTKLAPRDLRIPSRVSPLGQQDIDPAAWARFEVFAEGKKKRPERANDRLRFELRDEKGRPWPIRAVESKDANYLYVPKGYAVQPSSLTLTCKVGTDRELGPWKFPKIGPVVHRHLKPSPPNAMSKDFPGLKYDVIAGYEPDGEAAYVALRPVKTPDRKAGENLSVLLYGHEYGILPLGKGMSATFPGHFVKAMKYFEVTVFQGKSIEIPAEVTLPASRIEGPPEGRTIVFSSVERYPIKGGFVSFESLPSNAGLRLRVNFTMADRETALLRAASSDTVPVKYEGSGLTIEAPQGQKSLPAFKMKLIVTRFQSFEKRYVLPVQPGEVRSFQHLSGSRID